MTAEWQFVLGEVLVEIVSQFLEFLLASAVITHQNDILEAVLYHLIHDTFVNCLEDRFSQTDRARHLFIRFIGRKREYGRDERIGQLLGQTLSLAVCDERVTSEDILRSALFGSAVVHKNGGVTPVMYSVINFGVRQVLDLDRHL